MHIEIDDGSSSIASAVNVSLCQMRFLGSQCMMVSEVWGNFRRRKKQMDTLHFIHLFLLAARACVFRTSLALEKGGRYLADAKT